MLVVGCGSIGSRRARILAEMGHEPLLLDHDREQAIAAGLLCAAPGRTYVFDSFVRAMAWRPDAVFICTPADTHVRLAFECIQAEHRPRGIFIEKPLSVDLAGVQELAWVCEQLGIVTMGACNMRWAYRAIPTNHPPSEMSLVTSGPLSSWRPGATEAYAANGIVLESAIHDMDLATYFLGEIQDVRVLHAGDGFVDFVTDHPDHRCATITSDWRADAPKGRSAATYCDRGWRTYQPDTSDAMYRDEMEYFLATVEAGRPGEVANTIRNAAETLRWALRVKERAMGVRA